MCRSISHEEGKCLVLAHHLLVFPSEGQDRILGTDDLRCALLDNNFTGFARTSHKHLGDRARCISPCVSEHRTNGIVAGVACNLPESRMGSETTEEEFAGREVDKTQSARFGALHCACVTQRSALPKHD